ncbi:MAG: hypothetical protein R2771_16085 [Saprospiraceae bacterium]
MRICGILKIKSFGVLMKLIPGSMKNPNKNEFKGIFNFSISGFEVLIIIDLFKFKSSVYDNNGIFSIL